jgi:hypothetical protein
MVMAALWLELPPNVTASVRVPGDAQEILTLKDRVRTNGAPAPG